MKAAFPVLLLITALTGCAQTDVARRDDGNRHVSSVARHDYFKERRTITGSNVPTPRNQITNSPVSANSPSQGVAREHPSLYPTEPVVGATRNIEPSTDPVNVGAGPAGSSPLPSGD